MDRTKQGMGNPTSKFQLKAGFEQLIYREDYTGFFKVLAQVDPSSEIWGVLQVRSIDLLVQQGLSFKAIDKAEWLKNSLTDPILRKQAEIKYLYLICVVNRSFSSQTLKEECLATLANSDFQALDLLLKGTLLRLAATELMCGLSDALGKKNLIKRYIEHIKACQKDKKPEEAYRFLLELIQFLQSKPYPMPQRALAYLLYYRRLPFITSGPHRLATLDLQIAEIRLEHHLHGDSNKDHEEHYKLGAISFEQARHPIGQAYIQKSKGQTLLRYGKSKGRQLLYEAARDFEAHGRHVESLNIHSSIIQWLQTKGEKSAINSYLIKVNALREKLQLNNSSHKSSLQASAKPDNHQLLERTSQTIFSAYEYMKSGNDNEALGLVDKFIKEIEGDGKTIHLARVLACQVEIQSGSADYTLRTPDRNRPVEMFMELGYPIEAVQLIIQRLVPTNRFAENAVLNPESTQFVESDIRLIESILQNCSDLESRETLAKSYQSAACAWLAVGLPKKSLKMLQKAKAILKKHSLTYTLALNELYMGSILLEMCDHSAKNKLCFQASDHFSEAYQLFKLMNNHEGCWRSQFGMALSAHKGIAQSKDKSALLIRSCSENYLRAIEAVHYMTIHHLKTVTLFGESLVFSTRLQKGADQLYAAAIDFFVSTIRDTAITNSLLDKKLAWVLLNRNQPEIKLN